MNSDFTPTSASIGIVQAIRHGLVHAALPFAAVGDLCEISTRSGSPITAQISAVEGGTAVLIPLASTNNITPGCSVKSTATGYSLCIGPEILGSVVNFLGRPLEFNDSCIARPPSNSGRPVQFVPRTRPAKFRSVCAPPPQALSRQRIREALPTGVSSLDTFCSLGKGQRVGILAPAGLGKSTLLGMIARSASADVVIVALIGERGREVREFLEDCLDPSGLAKTVVVVSTSDEPPLARQLAAQTATSIAEHFRDEGFSVLLIVDSLTRVARAMRETGLANGEMPVRHGYPNSVYVELPKLVERTGAGKKGWITAIYTLLTNSDNDIDPLSEEVKSLLDGHIVLSEEVANAGIRPAVDPMKSVSRVAPQILGAGRIDALSDVRRLLTRAREIHQLQKVGVDPTEETNKVLQLEAKIWSFLNQGSNTKRDYQESWNQIQQFADAACRLQQGSG